MIRFCTVCLLVVTAAVIALDDCAGQPAEAATVEPDSNGVLEEPMLVDSLVVRYALRWPVFGTPKPEFLTRSTLEEPYLEGVRSRWFTAGSARTFESEHKGLEDFSKIDIPIKFPSRIGRVIGQGANLSVSGSEQISFGGQTRYRVNEPETEIGKKSKFPTLDMKQHLKIDLSGTVGEKIHVMVHHDSDIETPLENRIKLRYEGDDDEIVQSIEMGNTNLSIPGSQFVSYSGQQQGLFGAKMLAKVGPLDIAAIASKQEGRTAGASYQGAATRDSIILDDKDFVRHKYFYMIHPYDPRFDYDTKEFSNVVVYLDDGNGKNNENAVHAYAFLRPDTVTTLPGMWDSLSYAYDGDFDILEANRDYAVDLRTGEISLLRRLEATHTLAATYLYGTGTSAEAAGGVVGDSLMLKMIRPRDEDMTQRRETWGEALRNERKNVYSVGTTYISEEKVEVTIRKRAPEINDPWSQGDFSYSKILGIDLRDEAGVQAGPGNKWVTDEYADGGRVNGELGLLLFPDLRPFAPDFTPNDRPAALEDPNPDIYDLHYTEIKQEHSKYYMVIRFSTPLTTFRLQHINILENSEVVELNGRRLTRNVDYEIYYDIGQIRFKTEEAAEPDARITVDYQYVPFLSLAQQSLVGLQGIYRLSERSHIGTAWLYQSKKSPEERPRLGQEPSQVVMGDVNAQFAFDSDLLTSLVDGLPMVEADTPSRLTLSGELGMSFPNPNTKGDVYIDDMEGVRDLRSFSVMREAWVPASPPSGRRWEDTRRLWWYVKDKEVKEEDLFTKAESRPGEAYIPVLELNFKDFRYSQDWVTSDPTSDWGGLMRLVSKSGSDYTELKFIEVWLRQKDGDGGTMHIDLGALSENYYNPWEPDSLHDEDRDNDGKLSEQENTGLDGVFGNGTGGDDPYDNWGYTEGDYSRINGTEKDPRTVPDTEDLDGDGNLDTDEVYFRLSLDLADTSYIINEASKGWRQYRIPLADAEAQGGSPSWRSIKYIRFHFTEIDSPSVFQIAYLQVAGASWLDEGVRTKDDMAWLPDRSPDEVFEVSAKNTRDDPDYVPPYDPGKDPEGYNKREQSLVFSMRNLEGRHSGSVYKVLPGQANNYTMYQTLAFYVHGDNAVASEHLYMFVRFGADSLNFYEYGTRVQPGWRSIEVPLEEVTNLKIEEVARDSIYNREVDFRYREIEGGWIAVYGGPSITRVSRISAGVVNLHPDGLPTSSGALEVWFDDLRLTDVRKETGYAKRISIGASLSDVLTVNANFRQTDTEFQTLSAKRRGSDDTGYNISASTGLDRFLPDLGLTLPFSMSYNKSHSLPTLKSQSDIALKPDERKEYEKTSIDDSYRLAFSKKRKSKNPLIRLTLDAVSANASYTRKRGLSPELADTTYGYNGGISYKFSPWWSHALRIFRGYQISYLPENVSASVNGTAKTTKRIDKRQNVVKEDRYARDVKGVFSLSFKPFVGPSIETDYSIKTTRDLDLYKRVPLTTSIGRGHELTRSQRAGIRMKRTFGKWIRPTMSYDVNYDENADPKVRNAGDPFGVRRASVSSRSRADIIFTPGSVFAASAKPGDTTGVALHVLILSKIPDITAGYVIDRSSKYNKLRNRPGLKFQLGLEPEVNPDLVLLASSGAAQPTDEFTRKDGINVSTEFKPLSSVSLDTKYKHDKSTRTYAGSKTFTETSIWPDITGNISSLAYLSFLEGILKSSSIVMGYKGSSTARGVGTSETTNRTDKTEWVPLIGWDATWQNGVRTTFNLRRSTSEAENLQGTRSLQRTKTTAVDVSVRHSFSAPQGMYIPLAGRTLRFKSNLTFSLDINYETVLGITPTLNNRVDRNTRRFAILPKASYSFSKNITGSANITFRQDSDRKLGQTFRTIGVSASVLIRF